MFTARYALRPYIKHIRLVFEGLKRTLIALKFQFLNQLQHAGFPSEIPTNQYCVGKYSLVFAIIMKNRYGVSVGRRDKGILTLFQVVHTLITSD